MTKRVRITSVLAAAPRIRAEPEKGRIVAAAMESGAIASK